MYELMDGRHWMYGKTNLSVALFLVLALLSVSSLDYSGASPLTTVTFDFQEEIVYLVDVNETSVEGTIIGVCAADPVPITPIDVTLNMYLTVGLLTVSESSFQLTTDEPSKEISFIIEITKNNLGGDYDNTLVVEGIFSQGVQSGDVEGDSVLVEVEQEYVIECELRMPIKTVEAGAALDFFFYVWNKGTDNDIVMLSIVDIGYLDDNGIELTLSSSETMELAPQTADTITCTIKTSEETQGSEYAATIRLTSTRGGFSTDIDIVFNVTAEDNGEGVLDDLTNVPDNLDEFKEWSLVPVLAAMAIVIIIVIVYLKRKKTVPPPEA